VSLRLRIAAVAGLAVALAVLAAAISLYIAVRSDLRGQIDDSLQQRVRVFVGGPLLRADGGPGAAVQSAGGLAVQAPPGTVDRLLSGRRRLPRAVQPARFGGASGYVQFVSASGALEVPGGQGKTPTIKPGPAERAIAASGRGRMLSDRTVKGTHLRVLTLGTSITAVPDAGAPAPPDASSGAASKAATGAKTGASATVGSGAKAGAAQGTPRTTRGAVMIALPLTEVDHELSRILLILVLVGLAGIALAALLGALVARTALAPIARFTRRTESLAGELNLSERLHVSGGGELERLAASFNQTLDALERSLASQRQLIADASHELRTPIASLRANVQILEDAQRLPLDEQRRLRDDIVDELDELTTLVGDVVELARGSRAPSEREDVRLDEIVAQAVARTRRRGELNFELELAPSVVRGEADRINRAVSNLLDNARKWSPPGGSIEVTLRDGIVSVRDHGPGFDEQSLGKVFERFYRAESARKLPGSGLGLAIVRQAAEAHGGYARASNAPGGGARLEVSFGPALAVSLQAQPAAASSN
jgi:two-component system sensor histidine kinase MprB